MFDIPFIPLAGLDASTITAYAALVGAISASAIAIYTQRSQRDIASDATSVAEAELLLRTWREYADSLRHDLIATRAELAGERIQSIEEQKRCAERERTLQEEVTRVNRRLEEMEKDISRKKRRSE